QVFVFHSGMVTNPIRILTAHLSVLFGFLQGEPITLPLRQLRVPLALDNQTLNFIVDSGSAARFAIYGPWYEGVYGVGSCSNLKTGCYFCPEHSPCDDVMRRRKIRVRFGSGEVYRYVMHSLTLNVGNKTIQGIRLGLVVGYTRTLDINFPICAYLGLSMGREDGLPTFLE
ncbi:hypothetical protein FOZ62_013030, partial [Perkinsus olseni]